MFENSPETPYDESGRQKLSADLRAVIEKYGKLETSPLEVYLEAEWPGILTASEARARPKSYHSQPPPRH